MTPGLWDRMPTRRALLTSAAALAGCGRHKGRRFNGSAFIANEAAHSVAVIDMADFVLAKRIGLPGAPAEVTSAGPRVFVLVPEAGSVVEIDAATATIKRTVRVSREAFSMRLTPDGAALWVASADPPELARLNLETMRIGRRVRLSAPPLGLDLSRNATHAAVIAGGVSVIDLESGATHPVSATGNPRLLRFRYDWEPRQLLICDGAERYVAIVDLKTGRIMVRLPLPLEPAHMCVTADGGQCFVSGPGMDAVAVVFPFRTQIGETLLAGRAPGAMGISETPQYLFVANPTEGGVTILDIESRKLAGLVSVGQDPGSILFTPDNGYALVLNRQSGDVAVIRMELIRGQRSKSAPLFTMIPVGSRPVSGVVVAV